MFLNVLLEIWSAQHNAEHHSKEKLPMAQWDRKIIKPLDLRNDTAIVLM